MCSTRKMQFARLCMLLYFYYLIIIIYIYNYSIKCHVICTCIFTLTPSWNKNVLVFHSTARRVAVVDETLNLMK